MVRLFRSTVGRVSFRLTALFAAALGLCIAGTFYAQMRYIDNDVARQLNHELGRLEELSKRATDEQFRAEIESLQSRSLEDEQLYIFVESGQSFPPELKILRSDGEVFNLWVDARWIPGLPRDEFGYWPSAVVEFEGGSRLLVSIHSEINEALLHQVLPGFIVLNIILVAGMVSLGVAIGRVLLQRIDQINSVARVVETGDLTQRFSQDGSGDEFDELSSHFNTMLAKTERLITSMRRVSDNVAHDLRKPLSHIRSGLEVTLLEPRTPEQYQEVLEDTVVEIEKVIATFNSLLQIARVESGAGPRERTLVDLGQAAQEIVELYQDVAQAVEGSVEKGLLTWGDPHLIRQALSNLLENAIKFSPTDEVITVSVARREGKIHLCVADRGRGVPTEQREFVLERFARLEEARSTPGNGLGLAMVKATADLHNAELILDDHAPGLKVTLSFPSAEAVSRATPP